MEEEFGVLATLPQTGFAVGVEGPGLLDHLVLDAKVEQVRLAADPAGGADEHHVEFSDTERGSHFVLHDLGAGTATHDPVAALELFNAPEFDADGGVELEGTTARRHLRVAKDDADLLTELVDEDEAGAGAGGDGGELAQRL